VNGAGTALTVANNATVTGTLAVNGAGTALTVANNATVTGTLAVNGAGTALTVANNATVTGTLAVNGAGTALTVGNNVTVSGTLAVNGAGTALTVTANATIGNVTATSYNATSDYRIKANVIDLPTLYTIDNIRPVEYISIKDNKKNLGVIAHELQELYPCLVTGKKDGDEMQSVNYIGIIPLLIHEVKTLKKTVKQLQEDIEVLQR
jgi:hypothetical protein